MLCRKCGKPLQEGTKFCEFCGARIEEGAVPVYAEPMATPAASPQPAAAPVPPPYQMPVNNAGQAPQIVNNIYQAPKQPISVLGWIGRSLITCIPFVGALIYFIMLFVWSGDKTKEESFNNWAKAQLWIMLFAVIIVVLVVLIIAITGASLASSLSY